MTEEDREKLRDIARRHPDLAAKLQMDRFLVQLPRDREFGELNPNRTGCWFRLPVLDGQGKLFDLRVELDYAQSISKPARALLRRIVTRWPEIWTAVFRRWQAKYPAYHEHSANDWDLTVTIPSQILPRWFPGFRASVWTLDVDCNGHVDYLYFRMKGTAIDSVVEE